MATYKYNLIKYLKAKSTWIIAIFAGIVIGFILGGYVPFSILDTSKNSAATDYASLVVALVASITTFLSIFASVFAGFKAASMYKDEVEDGTFLVILSKPIKRSSIIFSKWLALQTIIFFYTLFVSSCFAIGVAIFDKGNQISSLSNFGITSIREQLPTIFGFLILILFVTSLIFSSISLLLSTKLSVGSTIGISIALGIFIPITSLIGVFTKKHEFERFDNGNLYTLQQLLKSQEASVPNPIFVNQAESIINDINKYNNNENVQNIYNLGISSGLSNPYSSIWFLDLNYHITSLAEFAYEKAIPESAKELAASSGHAGAPGMNSLQNVGVSKVSNIFNIAIAAIQNFEPLRIKLMKTSVNWLDAIIHFMFSYEIDAHGELQNFSNIKNILDKYVSAGGKNKAVIDLQNSLTSSNVKFKDIWNILKEIYSTNLTSYFDLLNTNKYETSSNYDDGWLFYNLNKQKNYLFSFVKTWALTQMGKQNGSTLNMVVDQVSSLSSKLEDPLSSYLLNRSSFDKSFVNFVYEQNRIPLSELDKLNQNQIDLSTISQNDKRVLVDLVSSERAGKLYTVQTKTYADKNWILVCYIILSLILVPIVYLVVRKQDFR